MNGNSAFLEGGHVGAGWEPIVKDLHERLVELDPNYSIIQVKEKFGLLRFYFSASDEVFLADDQAVINAMYNAVQEAEDLSATTCEFCGAAGTMDQAHFWIKTLCEDCKDKRARERRVQGVPKV